SAKAFIEALRAALSNQSAPAVSEDEATMVAAPAPRPTAAPAPPPPPPRPAAPVAAPAQRSQMPLIAVAAGVLLLAAAGGGAWWALQPSSQPAPKPLVIGATAPVTPVA